MFGKQLKIGKDGVVTFPSLCYANVTMAAGYMISSQREWGDPTRINLPGVSPIKQTIGKNRCIFG